MLPLLLSLLVQGRAWLQPLAVLGRIGSPLAAQLCRWTGFGVVLAGGAHALSAASASVDGLVVYQGTTPVGDPTNHVFGKVGTPFKARITVLNPGSDHASDLFDCRPVPPGLTIDTNAGAKGYILGTPTRAGTYNVILYAGNQKYDGGMVSMPAVIDIAPNGVPPSIAQEPSPQLVAEGGTAQFDVGATGDEPLSYQWWKGDLPVPGATLASLVVTNAPLGAADLYRVVVSNPSGSVTSAPAALTVAPFGVPLKLEQSRYASDVFFFTVTGPRVGTYVLLKSRDAVNWTAFATQRVTTGLWTFATNCAVDAAFFRASATP